MKRGIVASIEKITTEIYTLYQILALTLIETLNTYIKGMEKTIFTTLPKKPQAIDCEYYRTISFMSHITKKLLKIIQVTEEK